MKFVPHAISRRVARQALLGRKNSPTILFGVGVVGMIGSTVLACRATLKLEEEIHDTQVDLNTANNLDHPDYTEKERQKDVALIYTRSALSIGKLYAPAIIVGAASVGCLTKSHNLLNERVAAVTAAYAAVDSAFQSYRDRVVEKYGEEEDKQLRYSSEEVQIVNEDGKLITSTRVGPDGHSMYARFFDEYSANWSKDPEYNLLFLRHQQNWFNDLLKTRGHVFLNEVYEALDLSHTQAGSVVGWVVSDGCGDNYIDFGIYDNNELARDFVNGREGSVLLDFNVDGIIYDKLKSPREMKPWQS